ncbi:MAG TPA: ATP-binding protein [Candidatus Paceibacterota bacterium]|nr:ATP-binding protein [Verrucomicrobiota bacterium]HRY47383.1 ATP-binding protein [Candidatus Paceibacterota bacterium]
METILAKTLGQENLSAAAEERRQLFSRLLGRLAHEIRNPLSSLDIHVQLLEEDLGDLAPQAKVKLAARVDVIRGELHRLDAIVEQFLRLADPSAPNVTAVDLAKVIGHVCDVLRPEAANRKIELIPHLSGRLPLVEADSDQLIQATLNLVINALQAVDHCGRIELRACRAKGGVDLEVQDTGTGIAAEHLEAIFEPYFTTKVEGNGLGLWIAQQIVAAHGGTIRAANVPGGGAVFRIHLPMRQRNSAHG